ncbi:egg cell-secreted protein 1.4-like [Magnolia sinica]|uniref:egg cell-secreted protein 1.4-like n=1 Tax=Magnolia sinica TaxID=86752 RepID=UPI002657BE14|nr:egg cell-secreted protein 1.4-like [Magnolia sinica]XP_058088612.1 egg cell-secreted protein 1.4-like [Magnolia sinica]
MALQRLALLVAVSFLMAQAQARHTPFETRNDLLTRLESGTGSLFDCWNALLELRSCTNEIVLFFLNGESYLGPNCCQAIHVITRQCWPAMLASIGFTTEEGDILRGYCDASTTVPPPSPVSLGPVAVGPVASGVVGLED